jgi:hypothetical protein
MRLLIVISSVKSNFQFTRVPGVLLALLLTLALGAAQNAPAAILWTGPNTNFTQSATNFSDELVPGAVSLCRNYSQWLFNPDAGDQGPGTNTPTDTLWAFGTLDNYGALSYAPFASYRNGDLSGVLVGNPMVVRLVNEDIYLSVTFTAWPQGGGFFAYTRSTPTASETLPTVTITNPANGAVFAAPANVRIGATATVAGGSVTNVAFFANTNLLGAAQSPPFGITTGNLAAGPYALTAVATAAGGSATSSVVNITVVSPSPITLSSWRITNGQFAFDYSANPGLSYVVQKSSNLVNWLSLVTNVPASNSVHFTDSFAPNGARYYRVGRMPNP